MSDTVLNWIDGRQTPARGGQTIPKHDPHSGKIQATLPRSYAEDVDAAVAAARTAQPSWAAMTSVARGTLLFEVAKAIRENEALLAETVAKETGKSLKDALGEARGAAQLAEFFAGEGTRLYGRSLQSGTPNKYTHTVRQPLGIAALIVAANTPIANVAWKVFPALICGNCAVLKMAEDTPATGSLFARLAHEAGLPPGVLNVIHGLGHEAGQALVAHAAVDLISFTGSTKVGRSIAQRAGERLVRVSLELGGKNPLVVCDDADLDNAVKWTVLSSFSNAGQRCAASSRIIVFEKVYDEFVQRLVQKTRTLKIGNTDSDDLGPVINGRQLAGMIEAIEAARSRGARVLAGGKRMDDPAHRDGNYLHPTVLGGLARNDDLNNHELFGPVTVVTKAHGFSDALEIANSTDFGLTAAIHTRDINRAVAFGQKIRAGTVNINMGTYGSEPHFPFGGFGVSGNGSREPGVEALDVYSELKVISFFSDPASL